jgi:hypothetical protein
MGWITKEKGTFAMNNDNRDNGAHSGSLILAGVEPVESIEDLIRQRGFFDTVETDDKG